MQYALSSVLCFATPSSDRASSQESEGDSIFDILEEQSETITMGRAPVKVLESGSSAWIIDRAAIERSAASTLAELLRLIPGVVIRDVTPGAPDAALRFWAFTPDNHSLILVDGRYSQIDIFGDVDWAGIDLNDVERIEVILGPSSTLYGAYAFAGVVNIVTRRAESTGGTFKLRSGIATGGDGSGPHYSLNPQALGSAYAAWNQKFERASLRVSFGAEHMPSFAPAWRPSGDLALVPFRRLSGLVNASEEAGSWTFRQQLMIRAKETSALRMSLTRIEYEDVALSTQAIRRGLAGADDELNIMLWGRFMNYEWAPKLGALPIAQLGSIAGSGELFVQYRTPEFFKNRLIVGGQARISHVFEAGIPRALGLSQIYGVFAEDTWRPLDPLIITLGVRLETYENRSRAPFSRFSASPRGSVVWLVRPEHALRLEIATAFRNPTPHETVYTARTIAGDPILVGQTSINNENIAQLSIGYNGRAGWFKPRAEVFLARVANPIATVGIATSDPATDSLGVPVSVVDGWPNKVPSVFTNYDLVFWWPGATLKLEGDFGPVRAWLSYAFVPVSPQHSAGAHLSADWRSFNVTADAYFVDEFLPIVASITHRTPARIIANIALNYDINDTWGLQLAGTNLIDARFFVRPRPDLTAIWLDSIYGERIGPRVWLSVRWTPH